MKVKISEDGARMTRQTSFVVIYFSIVDSDDVMSSKGNLSSKLDIYCLYKCVFAYLIIIHISPFIYMKPRTCCDQRVGELGASDVFLFSVV